DAEILLESLDDLSRGLGCVLGLGRLSFRHDDPNGDLLLARLSGVDDLERPYRECDEIARERLRRRERERLPSVRGRLLSGLRRVRERQLILRDLERDAPRDLETRLVETRKRAACARGFELREDVPIAALFLAIRSLAVARGQLAVVGDVQLVGTRGQH